MLISAAYLIHFYNEVMNKSISSHNGTDL